MAISLTSIQNELLPGLAEVGRRKGIRIESYVEFMTDTVVVRAGEPGNYKMMTISRREIEDNEHITKLRIFMEFLMCASKGSTPVTQPSDLAKYQQLAQQKSNPADWNGYGSGLMALVRKAEKPVPEITARELTKEELRERVERKLDLSEVEASGRPVELINLGRWRQVMDEVFKEDDDKGGDDAKRTEEAGSNGGRKRGDGTGGDDA